MSRFGVLGSGIVGQTLAAGLKRKGHEVKIGSRGTDKLRDFSTKSGIPSGTFAEVARWAEHAVLAVKGSVADAAINETGPANLKGKLVMDVTNPIAEGPPEDGVVRYFTGPNSSLMEQLQTAYPDIHFVKAFNSVGNTLMVDPDFGTRPTMFYCGNDAVAKAVVLGVIEQFGWEGRDMGTVRGARAIEPLCMLWLIPAIRDHHSNHAFHLLWK
jgi:8-hydroxy-5-deazaflavin:NADPH oxidoreductase